MKVIIACESSEIVKEQFLLKGHDAHSCDLLAGEKGLPNHHQCDILDLLREYRGYFDMMIAHPPCTYLANSGVRWLHERADRWSKMQEGAQLFKALLYSDIPLVAIENPIPHKYAIEIIGRKYDEIIQPWWFGDGETKATCLWLVNLPPLMASVVSIGRIGRVWLEPPSAERQKNRSRTYLGIAKAMAEQWGTSVLSL